MGLFSTCAISHLPIRDGDDIFCFLLHHPKHLIGNLYPTGYGFNGLGYIPLTVPLFGQYDSETGTMKNIIDKENIVRYHLETLYGDRLYDFPLEENEMPKTIEQWISFLNRSNKPIVFFMFVHARLYLNLMNDFAKRIPYGCKENLFSLVRNDIHQSMEQYRQFYFEEKQKLPNEPIQSYLAVADIKSLSIESRFQHFFKYHCMRPLRQKIYTLENVEQEVIDMLADVMIFDHALSYMRMTWMPQVENNNDCFEMELHKKIAHFTLKHIQDKIVQGIIAGEDAYWEEHAEELEIELQNPNNQDVTDVVHWYR